MILMRLPNPTTTAWALIGLGTVAVVGLAVAAKARKPGKKPEPVEPPGSTCGSWGPVRYRTERVGHWVDDGAGGCRPQCLGPYKPAPQSEWAMGDACVPMFEPAPATVGDVMAEGVDGPVQWRVIWAYEPGNPDSPSDYAGNQNVYAGEFLDSQDPILGGGWEPFGMGFYDLDEAVANAKELAARRPWAPPTPPAQVGDIIEEGSAGDVEWRVIIREIFASGTKVYGMEFLDPAAGVGFTGWFGWGSGYYDAAEAAVKALQVAKIRPWAP